MPAQPRINSLTKIPSRESRTATFCTHTPAASPASAPKFLSPPCQRGSTRQETWEGSPSQLLKKPRSSGLEQ